MDCLGGAGERKILQCPPAACIIQCNYRCGQRKCCCAAQSMQSTQGARGQHAYARGIIATGFATSCHVTCREPHAHTCSPLHPCRSQLYKQVKAANARTMGLQIHSSSSSGGAPSGWAVGIGNDYGDDDEFPDDRYGLALGKGPVASSSSGGVLMVQGLPPPPLEAGRKQPRSREQGWHAGESTQERGEDSSRGWSRGTGRGSGTHTESGGGRGSGTSSRNRSRSGGGGGGRGSSSRREEQ